MLSTQNSQRFLVEWSPNFANTFILGSTDLKLYEVMYPHHDISSGGEEEMKSSKDIGRGGTDPVGCTVRSRHPARKFKIVKTASVNQLRCLQWCPQINNPFLIACGSETGTVSLVSFGDKDAAVAGGPAAGILTGEAGGTGIHHHPTPLQMPTATSAASMGAGAGKGRVVREFRLDRPCNAVAWNPTATSQLAVGLEKMRGDFSVLLLDINRQGHPTSSLAEGGGRHARGIKDASFSPDRNIQLDNGTDTVEVESRSPIPGEVLGRPVRQRQHSKVGGNPHHHHGAHHHHHHPQVPPLMKLGQSEAATSLCWVAAHSYTLAVGTGMKYLRLYDTRQKTATSSQMPVSVVAHAHSKSVLGVKSNTYGNPHLLATFGEGPQELVKVWDIRKLHGANPIPVVQIKPCPRPGGGQSAIQQIAWSPVEPGVLATTQVDSSSICLWDVSREASKPTTAPYHIEHIPGGRVIQHFSWQEYNLRSGAMVSTKLGPGGTDMPANAVKEEIYSNAAKAFANRLLVVHEGPPPETDVIVEDISVSKTHSMALSVQGDTVFGWGRLTFSRKAQHQTNEDWEISDEAKEDTSHELFRLADIDVKMKWRSQDGYCMDVAQNLQLLINEIDATKVLKDSDTAQPGKLIQEELSQLWRLWSWIERVEGLVESGDTTGQWSENGSGGTDNWRSYSLATAGILSLLGLEDGPDGEEEGVSCTSHPLLHCPVFSARGRNLALAACGWGTETPSHQESLSSSPMENLLMKSGLEIENEDLEPMYSERSDLNQVMKEREQMGHFERSAALAVFHGDLQASIAALRRGGQNLLQSLQSKEESDPIGSTSSYAELMDLVAMCIAGYSNSAGEGQGMLWKEMTQSLLQRISRHRVNFPGAAHLHACCQFLLDIFEAFCERKVGFGKQNKKIGIKAITSAYKDGFFLYVKVLQDTGLSMADRAAFACRFLPPAALQGFVLSQLEECVDSGIIEGLIVSGVGARGIPILQGYIDRTGDIQTVALVSSRVMLNIKELGRKSEKVLQWLKEYQELLNSWRMWHHRALFDVGRAELLREKARLSAAIDSDPNCSHTTSLKIEEQKQSFVHLAKKTSSIKVPDVNFHVPAQLSIRCNYCSTELPLDIIQQQATGGVGASWLSRQKPILTCCPKCRKALPKCYICLLPLGYLNPYLQLKRQQNLIMKQKEQKSKKPTSEEQRLGKDMSQMASIQFADWFTWCQRCKHGGHAHHISQWFENHFECGVSGCDCQCYFHDVPILENTLT